MWLVKTPGHGIPAPALRLCARREKMGGSPCSLACGGRGGAPCNVPLHESVRGPRLTDSGCWHRTRRSGGHRYKPLTNVAGEDTRPRYSRRCTAPLCPPREWAGRLAALSAWGKGGSPCNVHPLKAEPPFTTSIFCFCVKGRPSCDLPFTQKQNPLPLTLPLCVK